MLPYFFILGAFIGGMALAIDTTAGERERQSLEPLFVNPVSRSTILFGKLGRDERVRADQRAARHRRVLAGRPRSCRPRSSA